MFEWMIKSNTSWKRVFFEQFQIEIFWTMISYCVTWTIFNKNRSKIGFFQTNCVLMNLFRSILFISTIFKLIFNQNLPFNKVHHQHQPNFSTLNRFFFLLFIHNNNKKKEKIEKKYWIESKRKEKKRRKEKGRKQRRKHSSYTFIHTFIHSLRIQTIQKK